MYPACVREVIDFNFIRILISWQVVCFLQSLKADVRIVLYIRPQLFPFTCYKSTLYGMSCWQCHHTNHIYKCADTNHKINILLWAWKCYETWNGWGLQQSCFVSKPQTGKHLRNKPQCYNKNKLPGSLQQLAFVTQICFIHNKEKCARDMLAYACSYVLGIVTLN
jgi:hypothetical protein